MKCVILAAGKGSRLHTLKYNKPSIPILGVPLIERTIHSAMEAGADDFYVVTGYREELIRIILKQLFDRDGIRITPIFNENWRKENGISLLRAKEYLHEPFLLLMADHLFDPAIVRKLLEFNLHDTEMVLAVDRNIHNNPNINFEDVTKVLTNNGKIVDIGKDLTDFNGFDTGIFLCNPSIFSVLERSKKQFKDSRLSKGIQILASEGRANAIDINGNFWIDVDDQQSFKRAERLLLENLGNKQNDGPISHYINRPLSVRISRKLVNYSITPNQISFFTFFTSVVASVFFMFAGYPALLAGGILAQFASIIDGCDGEIARLKHLTNSYGGWLDSVLDRYADAFLIFGLTWHIYLEKMDILVLQLGFFALIGSFMVSYTAVKYDSLPNKQLSSFSKFRIGRDVRIFLIFLGALFNQAFAALLIIAVISNAETLRRLFIRRNLK